MENKFPVKKVMDDEGNFVDNSYEKAINTELVWKLYYHMHRIRSFDRKAINLQRQGRIGTYAPFEGQEASQVGSALVFEEDDWIFPTYRDHGATLTFGADMVETLLYWNGRVEGSLPSKSKNIFPPAVPIASQIPHAVGASWGEKRKGNSNIAIAYFGDGATSEGDFHEGLNFASVFQTPTIFFNQNNGYAISVPIEKQMNSKTIAQKALGYDIPSKRVDGNDCFSVYFETKKAVDRARKGKGPSLIEAVTWRKGAHTTADDPSKYRPENQGKNIIDPITRLERFMKNYGYWQEEKVSAMQKDIITELETAVKEMEAYKHSSVEDLFDHVYSELPAHLTEQKVNYFEHIRGV
ncbi:pyruvate dehydrogenase (acetyl-transferring) E1 component subunit alpha [Oceanobacillus sp. J11TS1]|uniref:pyruvate dehydrogenase (acetyl-transferring) E1 component subunit alpha n=1 Tax=Oceanobacillus sp. J11TS1 TaxID=2807191 RepID=UPI001B12B153|nr:pyruvate dehydrogenase (acetyl-transferring) E1 component subunit alpha [Oceanobacillus sp. J11TS1]GIO23647.1 pyruvate dehydrogenase (acetyl-transferring) E1 component subunit alpha [Oceanobacillus sp. J11TS1]